MSGILSIMASWFDAPLSFMAGNMSSGSLSKLIILNPRNEIWHHCEISSNPLAQAHSLAFSELIVSSTFLVWGFCSRLGSFRLNRVVFGVVCSKDKYTKEELRSNQDVPLSIQPPESFTIGEYSVSDSHFCAVCISQPNYCINDNRLAIVVLFLASC